MIVTLGTSVGGRIIEACVGGAPAGATIMVLAGFHGDEPKSVFVARRLIHLLESGATVNPSVRWVVVPVVNPDGYERRKRRNANQVDINRNFPTKNWIRTSKRSRMFGGSAPASEPETRAVIAAVERFKPLRIITIHSINGGRQCNNYDGPGERVAAAMSRVNGYPATSSIGYPTPGSLGTWAGAERNIPTITLELPSHHSPKRCWEENRRALTGQKKGVRMIFSSLLLQI
ncbi:MAG: M14 family zinc carboxypeptidase [Phycisphaerae bacterium]